MMNSAETNALLHKRRFSRIVTGASIIYVAVGLLAVGASFFLRDRVLEGKNGSTSQGELSSEQKALIEARIAGGDTPPLSDEQKEAIEARIASEESAALTAEQRAIIEARINGEQ